MIEAPPGKLLVDEVIAYNTGRSFTLKKGQYIRVIGRSTVDFVAFNLDNLKERFSQARTKTNQAKLFITKGDVLFSKHNSVMLTIVEDTWPGFHDMQKGMCDRKRHEMVFLGKARRPRLENGVEVKDTRTWEEVSVHGCLENLTDALKEWNIRPEDIPNPFNLYSHKRIDGETGRWWDVRIPLDADVYVDMRAEMNCLVAASHCDAGKGLTTRIQIYEG